MDNNSIIIMFAIIFIFIIYQQMQINKLSNNNQENFDAASDANIAAISNLGKLAGDILNKGALTLSSDLTISGSINLPNTMSLTSDSDWVRLRKTGTTGGDQSVYTKGLAVKDLWCGIGNVTTSTLNVGKGAFISDPTGNSLILNSGTNQWLFNTYPTNTNLSIRGWDINGGSDKKGGWTDELFKIELNGTVHVKGDLHVAGNTWNTA